MQLNFRKIIAGHFYLLFFLVPLILYPKTSELFELNKIVFLYLVTLSAGFFWIFRILLEKRLIFTKTKLFLPLLLFLAFQVVSTVFSIDTHTSLIGFYSRFNGGLYSTFAYLFLFFCFVSNLGKEEVGKSINYLLISAGLVSFYGILQHFGVDAHLWQQDVRERIFSTLGQPNWLATFLAALIPLATHLALTSKRNTPWKIFYIALIVLMFTALLFTKSRSGILGFGVSQLVFWGIYFFGKKRKANLKHFVLYCALGFAIVFLLGTPWTPKISTFWAEKREAPTQTAIIPALELGGSSSIEIRKIVWQGAWNLFLAHPIVGTGVETFGLAYYQFRPLEHNLVSEWDFLYNKAHNEYLNLAANTGVLGLGSYLFLVGSILYLLWKHKSPLAPVFVSSYTAILVSNFFGFSVVPVSTLFFLFPALVIVSGKDQEAPKKGSASFSGIQTLGIIVLPLVFVFLLYKTVSFWIADNYYSMGKALNSEERYPEARENLTKAINYYSKQPEYYSELAESAAGIALLFDIPSKEATTFAQGADQESEVATEMAPSDVNMLRSRANTLIKLSLVDPTYLTKAEETLSKAIVLAPTDAKLFYNLGLTYARMGDNAKATEIMTTTINLKPDYRNARFALGLLLADVKDFTGAKAQYEYILEFINPNDALVLQELENLK